MYTARGRALNRGLLMNRSRCVMLLLGSSCFAVLLLGLGHWSVWSRRACDARVAAATVAGAAATALLIEPPPPSNTNALEAQVRRLTAQVAYLTDTKLVGGGGGGGGRVVHAFPGAVGDAAVAGSDVVVPDAAAAAVVVVISTDPLAPPPPPPAAVVSNNAVIEPAPVSPIGARALLVICYNRPDYLTRTLNAVLERLPSHNRPHIFVSQDGADAGVSSAIAEGAAAFARVAPDIPFLVWRHPTTALRGRDIPGWATSYYALAQHFGWALEKIFATGFARAIILEDDVEVAVDFFDYMTAMEVLADADPRVLAVSAYNDIGQAAFVADARQVYRTDFFPGLGWMIGRRAWEEVGPKWPDGFWDDWLRDPKQRAGRHFLRPEVSRTLTFGAKGVSGGQFSVFLSNIELNSVKVDWAGEDVRYLTEPAWDAAMTAAIKGARRANTLEDFANAECGGGAATATATAAVSFPYSDQGEFIQIANRLGFIGDEKAGVQRTAYKGVVTFKHKGCRKLLLDLTGLLV